MSEGSEDDDMSDGIDSSAGLDVDVVDDVDVGVAINVAVENAPNCSPASLTATPDVTFPVTC